MHFNSLILLLYAIFMRAQASHVELQPIHLLTSCTDLRYILNRDEQNIPPVWFAVERANRQTICANTVKAYGTQR